MGRRLTILYPFSANIGQVIEIPRIFNIDPQPSQNYI